MMDSIEDTIANDFYYGNKGKDKQVIKKLHSTKDVCFDLSVNIK